MDGSFASNRAGAGDRIYSFLFSQYILMGEDKSSSDAEITFSLKQLLYRPTTYQNVVIIVDSKAAI